jgi:hypothetical protein
MEVQSAKYSSRKERRRVDLAPDLVSTDLPEEELDTNLSVLLVPPPIYPLSTSLRAQSTKMPSGGSTSFSFCDDPCTCPRISIYICTSFILSFIHSSFCTATVTIPDSVWNLKTFQLVGPLPPLTRSVGSLPRPCRHMRRRSALTHLRCLRGGGNAM